MTYKKDLVLKSITEMCRDEEAMFNLTCGAFYSDVDPTQLSQVDKLAYRILNTLNYVEEDMSTIRENLMNEQGYTPYCGNDECWGRWPRTKYSAGQFHCQFCNWKSQFPPEFIEEYKKKWGK